MIFPWLLLTTFTVSSAYGLYKDQGQMHKAFTEFMESQFHLRKLTVDSPLKTVRRGVCRWSMNGWSIGEYGSSYSLVYARLRNCTSYTKSSWASTFPCVLLRGSPHTTCQGPLPVGAEQGPWEVSDVNADLTPPRWTGPFPAAPKSLLQTETEIECFDRKLDCESLAGLTVARAVQVSGVYAGEATVACQRTETFFYVHLQGPKVYLWLRVHAPNLDREMRIVTKNMSWESQVDNWGRLAVSTGGRTVSYDKRILTKERLRLGGQMRYVSSAYSGAQVEPRLCPLMSASGACSVMNSLSESELGTLGNVTGFHVLTWYTSNGTVIMRGHVLGTDGILSGGYRASIWDTKDPAWMELPLNALTTCIHRIYSFSDCSELPAGGPGLSPYQAEGDLDHEKFS